MEHSFNDNDSLASTKEELQYYGPECNMDCPCLKQSRFSSPSPSSLLKRLNLLDRYLSIWILMMMVCGLLVGYFAPAVGQALLSVTIGGDVPLPVALGLIIMLLPVFCKVPYERLRGLFKSRGLGRQIGFSLVLNWLIGPALMTALAWATLPDLEHYRNGVILVGLARCIAMVLVWNSLAGGSPEYCTILVAVNSCLQLLLYSPMTVLFVNIMSEGGDNSSSGNISLFFWQVTQSVLIFLGIPFVAGVLIRYTLLWFTSRKWFEEIFVPRFSPLALLGLLYTIFVLFAAQGHEIVLQIVPVIRVAVPMLLYFLIMFFSTLLLAKFLHFPYDLAVTQAFTASSNNFELAIAIAVATFGTTSPEALAATVGPLIEVPVLLALVHVALKIQSRWFPTNENDLPLEN